MGQPPQADPAPGSCRGEKVFVDYSGHTLEVIDVVKMRSAQIFAAVLGASKYTYAEASFSQSLPDWIASQVLAFFPFRRQGPANVERQSQTASPGLAFMSR
jgi:transposase